MAILSKEIIKMKPFWLVISATDKQRICVKTQLKLSNTQLISNKLLRNKTH